MFPAAESIVVTVKYYALFFIASGYCPADSFNLDQSRNMGELLKLVSTKHGDPMTQRLFDSDDNLKSTTWLILNNKRIDNNTWPTVSLRNGDEIIISSPLLVGG